MADLINIFVLATIGSVAGLIGGVVYLFNNKFGKLMCKYAVPFAAGVLLSVSLVHLIPESYREFGEGAFALVLAAFLFSFLFEHFFAHLHHHEDKKHTTTDATVALVLFGDTIHNFIDGVAIAAAYITNPVFGLVVALATFLHETPHEMGDFGVLMSRGWGKRKTMIANFLSALATYPGAYLAFYLVDSIESRVGILLAVSAGVFLYLGASDFLPEVGESKDKKSLTKQVFVLIAGALLIYLMTFFSPE